MYRTPCTTSVLLALLAGAAQAAPSSLIAGASTDVPASANAAHKNLTDGSTLHVMSAITGVEFHVQGKISSAPGGLSSVPHPIRKRANGVDYWFISGELSGYTTDEWGNHVVIGPIDPQGVNHRRETFSPTSHPRAGQSGAFFALSMPVSGWNGGLLQMSAAGDAGFWWPPAPLLYNPVDPQLLLSRGYAVFAFGHGGTVPHGLLPGGERVVDTNPDSGTGIFWRWPGASDENHFLGLLPYARVSFWNDRTRVETIMPADFTISVQDPWAPGELWIVPVGDPLLYPGTMQTWGTEIIGDTIVFAKNLVRSRWSPVTWAALMGWSGSGGGAIQINSGTRGDVFQVPKSAGPQIGGGNFNRWHQPSSGKRYDAFIIYAGIDAFQNYLGGDVEQMADVDPDFPATAPVVWFVPEYDVTLPQPPAYDYANKIWRGLERLGRAGDLDRMIRIYSLPKATHQEREQLFAPFDSGEDDGLWFEYDDTIRAWEPFNDEHRGYRVSDPYTQVARYDTNDYLFFQGKARLPRDNALWLQTFANLRSGAPLPRSRVDGELFAHLEDVSIETVLPGYPLVPVPWDDLPTEDELFAWIDGTSEAVDEDTGSWINWSMRQDHVDALQEFAYENPLARSTRPLLLPDVAASLDGPGYYVGDLLLTHPLSAEELRARYHGRGGYVRAYADATFDLIRDGLWDVRLGMAAIAEAAAHSDGWPRCRPHGR